MMMKSETRTMILTAFMFELIEFVRCSRLVWEIVERSEMVERDGEPTIPFG